MRKFRRTTAEFVTDAQAVHGDRYDYSQANFVSTKTPVTIVCREHGVFQQSPDNHLAGKGCRRCATIAAGNRYRKSTEQFIVDARALHGDRFDYSSSDYLGAHLPVTIICPEHGPFKQAPTSHLSGAGCPSCADVATADSRRWTTEQFVRAARERFGDRFDYSGVDYKGIWESVLIRCPAHGSFEQTPVNHLNSEHACPVCSRDAVAASTRLTGDEFRRRAAEVHGGRYDYTSAEVDGGRPKVKIRCTKHGFFLQPPTDHLQGRGCSKCRYELIAETRRQTLEQFVARARSMHGSKYDYSEVRYVSARKQVTIVCPIHGQFQQTPDGHIRSGCRQCADDSLPGAYSDHRFSKSDGIGEVQGVLYYARFESQDGEMFYKVGISKNNAGKRFAGYAGGYGYKIELLQTRSLPLRQAYELEQVALRDHATTCTYRPTKTTKQGRRFGGRTECFAKPLPDKLVELLFS